MLKTLDQAIKILNLFGSSKVSWTAREISEHLAIPQVNVYRVLETYTNNKYLEKISETKQYIIGSELARLSNIAFEKHNVVKLIRPILKRIMLQTGESVYLVKLDQTTASNIDAIKPSNRVSFDVRLDNHVHLYEGASYWSILAFLPQKQIDLALSQTIQGVHMDASTVREATINGLTHVRAHGWCMSQELFTPDVVAIAAPIFLKEQVVGSLTLAIPTYRFNQAELSLVAQLIKDHAAEISNLLTAYNINLESYVYYRNTELPH